ncbi:ABC transporter ATP-binding protein [Paenibacillus sp. GCM10012306]|uniref:ABC transporter ATP-binding protein n=1 Tax=Paenibacillus sp. GCM10012306 TaxID=3317342 RepID=UPI0036195E0E
MQINTRAVLSLLFHYVKRYWIILIFLPLLIGVDIAFELGVAKIQGLFIDTADQGTIERLFYVIKLVICLLFAGIILLALHRHFIVKLLGYVHRDITLRLFEVINHMPYQKLKKYHSGDLVTRVKDDVEHSSQIIDAFIEFVTVLILIILSFVYLIRIDVVLALIGAISAPLLFWIGRMFDKRIRTEAGDVQEKERALRETTQEYIQGYTVAKVFNASGVYLNPFMQRRKDLNEAQTKLAMTNTMSSTFTESGFQLIYIVALVFIAIASSRNALTPGTIITFSVLFELVVWPVIGMSDQYSRVQEGIGAFQRIYEFVGKTNNTAAIRPKRNEKKESEDSCTNVVLSLRDVSLQPESSDRAILNQINFDLKKGETVVVIGPSGSGKSTFAKLCCGLYEPTLGTVSLHGQSVYVNQSPYLFSGTVKENIKLANDQAADHDIHYAARQAGLEEFIEQLPDKYNTVISEQGSDFSGGQRQRVALARAFLHKECELFIMDEPTSALDNATEQQVVASLKSYLKDRSAIIITHRLSLVSLADRIIVMNEGRIEEEGTHAELMRNQGLYKKFQKREVLNEYNPHY